MPEWSSKEHTQIRRPDEKNLIELKIIIDQTFLMKCSLRRRSGDFVL